MPAREKGYTIIIKGFLPVPKGDLQASISCLTAVDAAQKSGDLSGLLPLMTGVTVDTKETSRTATSTQAEMPLSETATEETPRQRRQREQAAA